MSKDSLITINTIFILYSVISSLLIFTTFLKLQNTDYSYLSSIGNNWKNGAIISIKTSKENCPIGYKSILNNFWRGTQEGCLCSYLNNTLIPGKCDRIGLKNGCKNINAIPKMNLNTWKGKKFCGKFSANYLNLNVAKNSTNCGEGNKSCGIVDTIGNHLCTSTNSLCPINFMKFSKGKSPNLLKDKKFNFVDFEGNEKMIFSNEEKNGEIFAEFKIEDNIPCESLKKISLIHTPYILEKNFNLEKCDVKKSEFQKIFRKIDSIKYRKLYKDNKIMNVISQLPKFSTNYNYLDHKTNLYVRNFIGIERECANKMLKLMSKEDLVNNLQNVDSQISRIFFFAFLAFAFVILGLFLLNFSLIFAYFFEKSFNKVRNFIGKITLITIMIPLLSILTYLAILLTSKEYDFSPLAEKGCSDKLTHFQLSQYTDDMDTYRTLIIFAILLQFLGLFVNVVIIIINSLEIEKKEKDDSLEIKQKLNKDKALN